MTQKHVKPVANGRPARLLRDLAQAAILGLLSTLPLVSAAQVTKDEEPKWYQVEVIIFERLPGSQAGDAEAWPKDVELDYPSNWQKLIAQDVAMQMVAALEAETEPKSPTVDSPVTADTPSATVPQADTTPEEQAETASDQLSGVETALAEPLPPILLTGESPELAFVKLPEVARTLNESKGAIARDRALRVLFHEAWRQPIASIEDAPAIIISGGNAYGNHAELEGSIQLSVRRYLHINTNLWHTHFIPNYGQEPEHWPAIPPVPEHKPLFEELESETALQTVEQEDDALWRLELAAPLDDYTALINQPFLVQEIITLRQTRRMRSGELHYLDHPRLGLLIKVEPYEPTPANGVL